MDIKFQCNLYAHMFLVVSSLGSMKGFEFEVAWTNLAALKYDVSYCNDNDRNDEKAVLWPIVGRFKAMNGVLDCYCRDTLTWCLDYHLSSGIQLHYWQVLFRAISLVVSKQVNIHPI